MFLFDDTPSIVENPNIRSLWPLTQALSAPRDITVSGRPVASLTLALNFALAGDVRDALQAPAADAPATEIARYRRNLFGYHAVNLAIHLAAGLVLFGVVRRTLRSARLVAVWDRRATPIAFAVALLWIVHPLQTESVTYVVQRVESLMGLFYLLTLYCAIRAGEPVGHRTTWRAASVAACALGMGTKEVMVSAPLAVWVWDYLFARPPGAESRTPGAGSRTPLYAALASTWIILGLLVLSQPRSHSVGSGLDGWTWGSYLTTQAAVVVRYLRLAIWPAPLVLDYGWPRQLLVQTAPQAVFLTALAATTAWGLWRRSPWAFAGAWFFAILAPTSSVLPIVTEVAAEHRMYLPLAAVIAVVVIGAAVLADWIGPRLAMSVESRRRVTIGAGVLLTVVAVTAAIAATRARSLDYRSEAHIWLDTTLKRPRNPRARVSYGMFLYQAGRFEEAESQLRLAVLLNDRSAVAHLNLGAVLCQRGEYAEGIPHLTRALALDPTLTQAYRNLGDAYAAQGRTEESARNFQAALDARPDDPQLLTRFAWLLATTLDDDVRDGARATALAGLAVSLTNRRDPLALDALAAGRAETGRFAEAASTAREALALARAQGRNRLADDLRGRLALYEAGQPFRQIR